MKPYGLPRYEAGDTDVSGCRTAGRATAIYNLKPAAYRSLRNGKKNVTRRYFKRLARKSGDDEIRQQMNTFD